tara:strand:- start:565 stop:1761 length:1197 start_codon:yes stop_codon:yes gene_type:complete
MISMAVLTPFFDVVAGVAILAGRSSLLDKGVFKTANSNFTVRHLLALGFIGYGGWNLWKIERAQDKLKKTLDAESFGAEFHDLDSDHEKYGESPPVRKEGFTPIGVYYVEGVGYCTGVAWAEKQAASFTDKPPVFDDWEYICDTCTYEEDECECGLDASAEYIKDDFHHPESPYRSDAPCPKCDDSDLVIQYYEGKGDFGCGMCGHQWFEPQEMEAEAFGGENLPHAYPELREYVFTNEESMEFDELIEARMRAAKEEGLEDWENDSNAHLLSGHIQDLIWEHDDFDAESFGAENKNEMELILAVDGGHHIEVMSGDEDAIKSIIKQSAFIEEYRPDIGMPEDWDMKGKEWLDQWFEDNDLETIAQETGWTITKVSSNAVFWGNRKGIIVADETWWGA